MRRTQSAVIADIDDGEIFRPVVRFDSIDVMNVFSWGESPSQLLLHHPSMLRNTAAISCDSSVFVTLFDALTDRIAILRTVLLRLRSARRDRKVPMTNFATFSQPSSIVSRFADDDCQSFCFSKVASCAGSTFSRTETRGFSSIWPVMKFMSAAFAGLRHSSSLWLMPLNFSNLGVKSCL